LLLVLLLHAERSAAHGSLCVRRGMQPVHRPRVSTAPRCAHRDAEDISAVSADAAAAAAGRDAGPCEELEPASMVAIARLLEEDSIAPQWIDTHEPSSPGLHRSGASEIRAADRPPRPRLPALREEEVRELSGIEDPELFHLSDEEQSLLQASLDSIDYLGDWSSPVSRDSIVLCCDDPHVEEGAGGAAEYTCSSCAFNAERRALHMRIIEQMLYSSRTSGRGGRRAPEPGAVVGGGPLARVLARRRLGGGQGEGGAEGAESGASQQHIFLVVGVPGSGKDSVIKRYLRTLDIPLLDASADLVKECLAAWGKDELSTRVRENNAKHGPGKHLLHGQYLHRESILLNDQVVEQALREGRSIMIEKTLHDNEHVLTHARRFGERGCRVHLIGTHITPLANWKFLCNRMASGGAFGRHISKPQAIASLRRYHSHFDEILEDRQKRTLFDSIFMFDVIKGEWCVRIPDTRVAFAEDGDELEPILEGSAAGAEGEDST
jgi:chloramphenicol 3-O-phosphotransferase